MGKVRYLISSLILLLAVVVPVASQNRQMTVRVAPGYATVIVCPAPPDLVTVGNVDAFSVQSAGNYILVKPLISKGRTNMFIKAGVESFNLLLEISDKADLTVKLASTALPPKPEEQPGSKLESEKRSKPAASAKRKPLTSYGPKVINTISSLLKATNRYTYSINNSKVIFAVDHLKQIDENLFVIGTIINNSNVPYDIGFVQFKMIEYARSYIFWKKKKKETELEPVSDYYNSIVKPHTFRRVMFVFDKQGFSANNTLYIKCDEENGRRVLELELPASMIQ